MYVQQLFKQRRFQLSSGCAAGYQLLTGWITGYLRNRPDRRIAGYEQVIWCDPKPTIFEVQIYGCKIGLQQRCYPLLNKQCKYVGLTIDIKSGVSQFDPLLWWGCIPQYNYVKNIGKLTALNSQENVLNFCSIRVERLPTIKS